MSKANVLTPDGFDGGGHAAVRSNCCGAADRETLQTAVKTIGDSLSHLRVSQ